MFEIDFRFEGMSTAKTQKPKAKSQWPTTAFFAHSRHLSCGDVLRKNAALSGHTLVHGGSGNWDPNGRPQTAELQAFLGFPAQLAACPTAVISGAAPVNVTLTLDENETKVKYYFSVPRPSS